MEYGYTVSSNQRAKSPGTAQCPRIIWSRIPLLLLTIQQLQKWAHINTTQNVITCQDKFLCFSGDQLGYHSIILQKQWFDRRQQVNKTAALLSCLLTLHRHLCCLKHCWVPWRYAIFKHCFSILKPHWRVKYGVQHAYECQQCEASVIEATYISPKVLVRENRRWIHSFLCFSSCVLDMRKEHGMVSGEFITNVSTFLKNLTFLQTGPIIHPELADIISCCLQHQEKGNYSELYFTPEEWAKHCS